MSDYEYDDQPQDGPKNLRDALDKAKAEARDNAKKLEEALARLNEFEKAQKASSIADLLKAKNVDPKYAKWADKDGVEPTEEAINAWIEENRDLIPTSRTTDTAEDADAPENNEADEPQGDPFADLPPEMQAALASLSNSQQMEAQSVPTPPVDSRSEAAQLKAIAAINSTAKTPEEALAALAKLGAPVKSGY